MNKLRREKRAIKLPVILSSEQKRFVENAAEEQYTHESAYLRQSIGKYMSDVQALEELRSLAPNSRRGIVGGEMVKSGFSLWAGQVAFLKDEANKAGCSVTGLIRAVINLEMGQPIRELRGLEHAA